ncbi:hypothetical protein BH11PSE4_BH11PSE4_17060 [soil metagenome]
MVLQALSAVLGIEFIVRRDNLQRTGLLVLLLAPLLAGCAGMGGDMFSTDLLSKDADWFSRPGRVFIKNVSIDSPPLTPDKPVGPDDLISADGMCPGMAPPGVPGDANALADGAAGAPIRSGVVALGHTECDVARGNGAPDSVNLSTGSRGERVAVLTYSRGGRPGIYTFTAGRLTVVERAPEPVQPPKVARPKPKRRAAT